VGCRRKEKHPPKLVIFSSAGGLETSEHIGDNGGHQSVAGHLVDGVRFVLGERERKRQRDTGQDFGLPPRV
jgi:hypothetical protein